MTRRVARERWLLGATVASGLLALSSHGGGPTGCSTTARQVAVEPVSAPLRSGQRPDLPLTTREAGSRRQRVERIERGTQLALHWLPGLNGGGTSEGRLAGFDPARRRILFTSDGETAFEVNPEQLASFDVLGESPTAAHVGNGALIGGLSGAAVGALAGAGVARGGSFAGLCAAGFGTGGALVGSGIGAAIGAGVSPGRRRTEYRLGPNDWQVASEQPAAPWSRPPRASGGEAP